MLKHLAVAALSLSLAGCVMNKNEARVKIAIDTFNSRPPIKLARPGPIKLERVRWIVVTKENAATVLDGLGGNVVAITPDGFSKLQRNNAKLLNLVQRYRKIVIAYEAYNK